MKTIGIIALSGACEEDKVLKAKTYLESKGFCLKLSKNIFDKDRYLAGSDEKKIEELSKFFKDPDIDIIMSARGGYGAIRLINRIDYDVIKCNPKIFCGYSDATALLIMIYKNTGLVTYHGPMAISDFAEEPLNSTYQNFITAISDERMNFSGDMIYKDGAATGIIWGGNLATVVSLCGLNFIPQEDFIFFAEDLNEPVYKIDKMFQQLINISDFKKFCRGIVLGDFLDCGNDFWLEKYFHELASRLNIPIVSGFKITHNKDKITIPIGSKCSLIGKQLVIR